MLLLFYTFHDIFHPSRISIMNHHVLRGPLNEPPPNDPKTLFDKCDEDNSGTISLKEFRSLLPQLRIHVDPAKSLRFFKFFDRNSNGSIDFEEFLALLYVCDANENPAGFNPTARLGPKDAFHLFDVDNNGERLEEIL